jgi:hypothetical protein
LVIFLLFYFIVFIVEDIEAVMSPEEPSVTDRG